MEEKLYCISYDSVWIGNNEIHPDYDYIMAKSDEDAISIAKQLTVAGLDYKDVGHVDLELLSVTEIDTETGDDLRTVWC